VIPRYLIVGMGAAGIAAAEAIRQRDASADILLLSDDPYGYYSRPGLAYYLTGEVSQDWLYPFSERDFERLNLRRQIARVQQLFPQSHQVRLDSGAYVPYDRLLLATGSLAVNPPLPGTDLTGVVKLDDMEDARRIVSYARRARAAVVIGGGITALELVEGLRNRRVKTHYFLRRDRYWGNVLDDTESGIVQNRLQQEGVELHFHTEAAQILGRRGRVAGVLTEDGRQIDCDLVAIAVGVRPRLELARQANLETDRGILVDRHLQSSVPDVFAAGDVAQVHDPLSGRSVLDTLWGVAVDQGRAAGRNMTGDSASYRKAIPFNVTRLAGLTTTIIGLVGRGSDSDLLGIARGDSETWRELPDVISAQRGFEVNRIRVLISGEVLVGAIVMGDQTLSQPLHHLVSHQAGITSIRDALLDPAAKIGDVIAQFWTEWRRPDASARS
jgi:nitrite reductase (NADH) large subunit